MSENKENPKEQVKCSDIQRSTITEFLGKLCFSFLTSENKNERILAALLIESKNMKGLNISLVLEATGFSLHVNTNDSIDDIVESIKNKEGFSDSEINENITVH